MRSVRSMRSIRNWQNSSWRAFVAVPADVHHAFPLPAHGDARMDRGEDPQALVLEEVGQALEDERGVGRVRLDDRHLVRAAVVAGHGAILGVIGVADGHVETREARDTTAPPAASCAR